MTASLKLNVDIVGSGRAASVIHKSLVILGVLHPELQILQCRTIKRGEKLKPPAAAGTTSLLIIANPHGLHARYLQEGVAAGYDRIFVEKPACVQASEIAALRALVKHPIAVGHGYRQSWGLQKIKELIKGGTLGELFRIEGRYWQSSAAQRALENPTGPSASWKNEIALSGAYDVTVDLATHWADLATFLAGSLPTACQLERSYVNAEAPHRDTHVDLKLEYGAKLRSYASVSKTWHGFNNHLEVCVLGSRGSAMWNFLNPDEIRLGAGARQSTTVRTDTQLGSQQSGFHAMGWAEGYIEILRGLLFKTQTPGAYPTLQENLDLLECLFKGTQPA